MKILAKTGREDLAVVYLGQLSRGRIIEFVESLQPPLPRSRKWVLIVSTLYGCPVKCKFCDCSHEYQGKLTPDEIISQIDHLITNRYPDRKIPVEKLKIQFARMGEPAFNGHVLEVLKILPELYQAPGLMPCLSTIAPESCESFFDKLLEIKKRYFDRNFQLQFSIHSTDQKMRDWLIPVRKWNFSRIASYGRAFYSSGGRKITLNFALTEGQHIDPSVLRKFFSPEYFMIKITPVNPTYKAREYSLPSILSNDSMADQLEILRQAGYHAVLSIGEKEEDLIGSNCGEYITAHRVAAEKLNDAYTYDLEKISD